MAERALRGVHHVTLTVRSPERSAEFLTSLLGFRTVAEHGSHIRVGTGGSEPGQLVDLAPAGAAPSATNGLGTVHHVAFAVATAAGLVFAKIMNLFLTEKINPLVGAAGVSAVPDSARVVQMVGQQEDPENFLLMHAMAPNVAGVIGSAVAAGLLWSVL